MHVFLTGATGFVGTYILKELLGRGHTVRCLVRDPAETGIPADDRIEKVKGDVTKASSLTGLIRGCDAVIHLVGIIHEAPSRGVTFQALHVDATRHIVDEALDSDINTFVHMSANGASPQGVSGYQTTKWQAEEYVRKAGFEHATIFRPSVIFGRPEPGQPEFASQLVNTLIAPFPVWPVFGDGAYMLQPIAVEDVASAFVQALTSEAPRNQTYCVAGLNAYPYTEVLELLAEGAGVSSKPQIKQPIWLVRPVIQTLGRFDFLPITPDQFEMLIEGNTCDPSSFFRDFELQRILFIPENLQYLRA